MQVNSYVEYTNPKEHPILKNFMLYKIVEMSDKGVRVYSHSHDEIMDGVYPVEDFTEATHVEVYETCAIWRVDYVGELLARRNQWDDFRRAITDVSYAVYESWKQRTKS